MNVKYVPKDIFEKDFKVTMRGYDRREVDEFLDVVIKDYEAFMAEIERLKAENSSLKKTKSEQAKETVSSYRKTNSFYGAQPKVIKSSQTATNLDILKRISRLEKEVFGKQIKE
ncbi:cell division regulator GpsB [Streptococcus sciuri]|uniref:Cell cycle protein GpsB n=1 Tax=Streptococcus sciuri TaxID=2973939 RepID=A0ABT2F9V5_9STRE|nr:cell division regulator GpsB [Streptococcus sciuri]MCS4488607.1 cell division regulator GpsB [Streptococcus sciuri]